MERKTFEEIFMEMAESVSGRSYDPKLQVGCVITSLDHCEVHSIGYNGNAHGLPNERDSLESEKSGFIHAELNAVIKCNSDRSSPKNVYITHLPCKMCCKAIIQLGGVRNVYFRHWSYDTSAIDLFPKVGINLIHHPDVTDSLITEKNEENN